MESAVAIEREKMTEHLQIRLTKEDKAELETQAASKGLSVSSYMRYLLYREKEMQRKGGT